MLSMYRMGYKPDVIGKHFNMTGQSVRNQIMIMKRHGIDVTVDEHCYNSDDDCKSVNESILIMYRNSLKLKIIAKRLDVSIYTVRKKLKELSRTDNEIPVYENK